MFPSAGVQPVTTEQEVYDSATDGIMTINNEKYIGPSATVTYAGEDQGYTRTLRQIEQGELPQFDQSTFPKVGEGIMSTPDTTAKTTDTTTTDIKRDPCPPGFVFDPSIEKCVAIAQPQQDRGGRDRPTFTGPKVSKEGVIEGYTSALNRAQGSGALNSARMAELEKIYGPEVIAEIGKINNKYRNRGVQIKTLDEDDPEIKRLQSVYGQDRVDQDYIYSDGKYHRIIATSPTLGEVVEDAATAVGDIIESTNIINVVKNALSGEEDKSTSDPKTEDAPKEEQDSSGEEPDVQLVPQDFGGIDNISDTVKTFNEDFGTLQSSLLDNQKRLQSAQEALADLESQQFTPSMMQETKENIGKQEGLKSTITQIENNIRDINNKSKAQENAVQNELNNSKESTMTVKGSNFTVHTNNKGKIVGYSKPGSNIVNMAGMPPVGPGQRIKTKPKEQTVQQKLSKFNRLYRSGR